MHYEYSGLLLNPPPPCFATFAENTRDSRKKTKLKLGREKRKKEAEQGEGERLRSEKKKFHEKIFLLEFDYVVLGSRREAIERRFVGK